MAARVGVWAILTTFVMGTASAATRCGELANAVGPYDYQTTSQKKRDLVEHFHFTESVETLRKRSELDQHRR